MNCIVSGGTGFIGRAVVARLESAGHRVRVWSRKGQGPLVWDPLTGSPDAASLAGVDAVIHLAGEPVAQRWNDAVRAKIRDSRVLGTRRLVDALARCGSKPAVLVSASAIGIYGDRGDEVLTETSAPGSGFLVEVCQGWEAEADRAEEFGLRVLKPRIGFVLGNGGGALVQMVPLFRACVGGRLGSGKQWMPWVHLDDVVSMIVRGVEDPAARGVWNATAPEPVTNAEFTRQLARAVGRPALFPVPPLALKIAFGDLGRHMLDSARVLPKAAEAAGFAFAHPKLREALASLKL